MDITMIDIAYGCFASACLLVGITAILGYHRLGDIYRILCEIADGR